MVVVLSRRLACAGTALTQKRLGFVLTLANAAATRSPFRFHFDLGIKA